MGCIHCYDYCNASLETYFTPLKIWECLCFNTSNPYKGLLERSPTPAAMVNHKRPTTTPVDVSSLAALPTASAGGSHLAIGAAAGGPPPAKRMRLDDAPFSKGGAAYSHYLSGIINQIGGKDAKGRIPLLEQNVTSQYPERSGKHLSTLFAKKTETPGLIVTCLPYLLQSLTSFHVQIRDPQNALLRKTLSLEGDDELDDLLRDVSAMVESWGKVVHGHSALLDRLTGEQHKSLFTSKGSSTAVSQVLSSAISPTLLMRRLSL